MAEAITSTTDTHTDPKILLRPPPPSTGSLDPLANCTKLETLNLICCKALTGTSSVNGLETANLKP